MNPRNFGRSPNDRQLDQFLESVGELGKEELLEKFEQAFCEIVPPARAASPGRRTNGKGSEPAVYSGYDEPRGARRRPPGKVPSARRPRIQHGREDPA